MGLVIKVQKLGKVWFSYFFNFKKDSILNSYSSQHTISYIILQTGTKHTVRMYCSPRIQSALSKVSKNPLSILTQCLKAESSPGIASEVLHLPCEHLSRGMYVMGKELETVSNTMSLTVPVQHNFPGTGKQAVPGDLEREEVEEAGQREGAEGS